VPFHPDIQKRRTSPLIQVTTNPTFAAEAMELEEYATSARFVSGSTPIA